MKTPFLKTLSVITIGMALTIGTHAKAETEHKIHDKHEHVHKSDCGHKSEKHNDHTDYEHDGHHHNNHEGHWDECDKGPHSDKTVETPKSDQNAVQKTN